MSALLIFSKDYRRRFPRQIHQDLGPIGIFQVPLNIWIAGTHSSQLCVQNKAVNAGDQAFLFLAHHNSAPPFVEFFAPFPQMQKL